MRIAGLLLIVVSLIATVSLYIFASKKNAEAERVAAYWHQRQQASDEYYQRQGGGQPSFASRNIAGSTVQRLNDQSVRLYSYFKIAAIGSLVLVPLGSWMLVRSSRVIHWRMGESHRVTGG